MIMFMQMNKHYLYECKKKDQLSMVFAVPQSLFGKRVSVKRHAVKIQRMSELDESQKNIL